MPSTGTPPSAVSHQSIWPPYSSDALNVLLAQHYTTASNAAWDIPRLPLNQVKALCHLGNPSMPSQMLFVENTGSVKTHMFNYAGVTKKGIIVIMQNNSLPRG